MIPMTIDVMCCWLIILLLLVGAIRMLLIVGIFVTVGVLGLGSLSTLAGRETIRTFAITAAWRFAAALGIIVRPERVLIEAIADFGVLWYRSEQQTKM